MVVHEPGPWFEEVLDGLADQDYGSLKLLFLLAGEPGDLPERIRARVPDAFVRAVDGNPGYGATANEVLSLVEGESGFFCFLHDDVALEPAAVRLLVEELYRSNAGIVGPKLSDWDDPGVLQHVGLAVDRFGAIDSMVESGEVDQEQHDAVRDVFALPSACLLVRADLFRLLEGFDPAIEFYGDDVDLCWRAHLGGARVVVVPAARARHREKLPERRPDLRHDRLRARHRVRSVATLTGARRLLLVSLQLVVLTLAELVAGVFTGTLRQAWASLVALLGAIPRTPTILARRREIAPLRQVPNSEVAGLQLRGSARLSSYLRARDSRPLDPDASTERRWRQTAGSVPSIAWLCVLIAVVIGSRQLITGGVPEVGEFLRFPSSPSDMLADYRSGWWGHGLGATVAAPTGVALAAVGSVTSLFHMGLWHTVAILGLLVVGYAGMWRLASLFPTPRARVTALVVYAALPLPSELLSVGRWGALACYAAMPWVVHLLRRAAGIETIGSTSSDPADRDTVERYAVVAPRKRLRLLAQLALLTAVVAAFAPSFLLLLGATGVVLAVTTLLARGSWRAGVTMAVSAFVVGIVALVANLPWSESLFGRAGWDLVAGVPPVTSRSLGVVRLARFGVGNGEFGILAIALMVPVVSALLVARSWRLTWAIRAAGLVVAFGWLAILDDGRIGRIGGIRMPEPGVLLAPVAVGVALSAACIAAAFQDDVLSGSFGWRQPLGVLSACAIVVGILPGVIAVGNGRWNMPRLTLTTVLGQLPSDPVEGDYRVLWIGDPQVLPVAAWTYHPGIGYALTDDGPLTMYETWAGRPTAVEREVAQALDAIGTQSTLRAGRLLAPFGVRYIVVPLADGAIGTTTDPVPPPVGLIDALDDQLDLATPLTRPLNYVVYENMAWTPVRSQLTPAGAAASQQAGDEALASADLSGSTPFGVGARDRGPATGPVQPGVVHVAVPVDQRWTLEVDGRQAESHPAFGSTIGFDVPTAGAATLRYDTSLARPLFVILQLFVWVALVLAASRFDPSSIRRRRKRPVDEHIEPVLQLTEPILVPGDGGVPWQSEDGGAS